MRWKIFSEMDPVDCGCWVDAPYRINTIQATHEDHILASHPIFITCHPIIRRLRALYFSRYIGYPSIAKWMDGNIKRRFSILNLIFCWLKLLGNDKGNHHWCLYSHHLCTECMWYHGTLKLIFATCHLYIIVNNIWTAIYKRHILCPPDLKPVV